jgi:hypothetical protein
MQKTKHILAPAVYILMISLLPSLLRGAGGGRVPVSPTARQLLEVQGFNRGHAVSSPEPLRSATGCSVAPAQRTDAVQHQFSRCLEVNVGTATASVEWARLNCLPGEYCSHQLWQFVHGSFLGSVRRPRSECECSLHRR